MLLGRELGRGQGGYSGPMCWKARPWILYLIMLSMTASSWIMALLDQDVGFLTGFQKWTGPHHSYFLTAAALGAMPSGLNRHLNWGDRCSFYDAKWNTSQRTDYGRWALPPKEHLFKPSFFLHKFEISKQFLCIHGLSSSKCKSSLIQFSCHFHSLAVTWVRSHNYYSVYSISANGITTGLVMTRGKARLWKNTASQRNHN